MPEQLTIKNTLAYYCAQLITTVKSFIVQVHICHTLIDQTFVVVSVTKEPLLKGKAQYT
jgi:hypothetical protein